MFDPKHIHIAVASDDNYARFVSTLIVSIAKNNNDFKAITIHLLANKISNDVLAQLETVVSRYSDCILQIHDISNLEDRLGIDIPKTIALTAYARLFMTDIIDKDVSKILYLDTDIIVNGGLSELWNIDLKDKYIGGCLDVFEGYDAKTDVGLKPDDPYVNSGVLMINLDKWREDKISMMFMDFLYAHNGNVHHHDQGIINGVCKGHLKLLPPEYNMHSTVFSHPFSLITKITCPYYTKEEYDNAIGKPIIIHFTEGFYNRPWRKNCKHPLKQMFINVQKETPWADVPLQPDNRPLIVKIQSYCFIRFPYCIYSFLSKSVGLLQSLKG